MRRATLETAIARRSLPKRGDCFQRECPGRAVLAHVAGRWGSLVVGALRRTKTLRFSELRRQIDGISEKMLAQTLRELERDGLVSRRSHNVVPPRVDYELTALGIGVADHVEALLCWIDGHVRDFVKAQRSYDR